MIVSSSYLQDISRMLKPAYFKIEYARKICKWVLEYFEQYKEAPGRNFESIFYAKAAKLKGAEIEIMEEFLISLSDKYISPDESLPFNKPLLFDQTVEFCRDRALEIHNKTVEGYRLQGDFAKAEAEIANFGAVAKTTSQWVNPFETEEIYRTFEEDDEDNIFKLPGAIGELIGWIKRGWLISIIAPQKRGKSFYEWEIIFHALCAKKKVAIFSFEMNKTTYKKRIYKRLTAMAENGGEYAYPVFDCFFNQDGSCQKPERVNRTRLLSGEGILPKYSPSLNYRVCDVCRGKRDYKLATWWQTQNQKENLSPEAVIEKVRAFKKLFGDNLRIRCFPAFSAGFAEAKAELQVLKNEGFDPDILAYDYFDIMAAEVANELEDENRKWKQGKGQAGEEHCAVINCNQGNRQADETKHIKTKHTGGNIKKGQHLDLELALNQLPDEKRKGIMRMQVLLNRHDEGTEKGEVFILQALKLGQPLLDSEWGRLEDE